MSMYALQVMTGMEAEITQKLRGKGVDARCPQERRMIRRGGKWQEQLYTLFPSYIFVSTPDVYRVYYGITRLQAEHWLVLLALAVPLVMPPQMLLKVSALQETLYM